MFSSGARAILIRLRDEGLVSHATDAGRVMPYV